MISLSPGHLIREDEVITIEAIVGGQIEIQRNRGGVFSPEERMMIQAGESLCWQPEKCGLFLVTFTSEDGYACQRMISVVNREWAVCQITVGAFTAEDFAEITHPAGLAVDYYVNLPQPDESDPFDAIDERWLRYEREFGDVIHPHVMASSLGGVIPECRHDDPNWATLPPGRIEDFLRALQGWWAGQGFSPLDRIASYTPCNELVRACGATGVRLIHSLCAEQNWSDGEWAINHWGMPTAPYWIARDDFRKAGARSETGVMGMVMNHYHVLIPHLTHWGDFVLSPSHFTRWIRAADSGQESTRFRTFLEDTVQGGSPLDDSPFFFVAGFEFGRTFGTANMSQYNRAGLRRLIELSGREKLAFATSSDVRSYYDRHVAKSFAGRAFRQRDYWVGVTVNGKPAEVGDSIVIETPDYKAVIRDGEHIPFLQYDYTAPWNFEADDINAPDDFAGMTRQELKVISIEPGRFQVSASTPLSRAVPCALWDLQSDTTPFRRLPLKDLEDSRRVEIFEVPRGWQGTVEFAAKLRWHQGKDCSPWIVRSFGRGDRRHTYIHLDAPLTLDITVPVELRCAIEIDSAQGPLGRKEAGSVLLTFGPLCQWHRFWRCEDHDFQLPRELPTLLLESGSLRSVAAGEAGHFEKLDALAWNHPALKGSQKLYAMHCGARRELGTRSRSAEDDMAVAHEPGVTACEFSDGVISFGPAKTFWYHPRTLHFRVDGLAQDRDRWTLLLHSFDHLQLGARYRVSIGKDHRPVGTWDVPADWAAAAAFYPVELTRADFTATGRLIVHIESDQSPLVHWWKEGGFVAALHAFWIAG